MSSNKTQNRIRMKKKKKPSPETPPLSFLSLPYDVLSDSLARISRTNYPTLSIVSKSFRSFLASPHLEAARSLIGRPESYFHVCLNLNDKNPNPSWFIFSQRKLIPTPSFPYKHLKFSSIVSTASETYIIGGVLVVNGRKKRSKGVFLIDFKTHQWRKLLIMRVSRKEAVVEVMDGKLYVIGGCSRKYSTTSENYGEVYDPSTQTWEPTSATPHDLPNHFDQERYSSLSSTKLSVLDLKTGRKLLFIVWVRDGELCCGTPAYIWVKVLGLEAISSNKLLSVTNPGLDERVMVWWKTTNCAEECKTEIWCAQILLEFGNAGWIWGFIEWTQNVYTFQGCHESDDDSQFVLHSALVTHDY